MFVLILCVLHKLEPYVSVTVFFVDLIDILISYRTPYFLAIHSFLFSCFRFSVIAVLLLAIGLC